MEAVPNELWIFWELPLWSHIIKVISSFNILTACTHMHTHLFHHAWGQPILINNLFFSLFLWTLGFLRAAAVSYGCHCCVWCRLMGVCQGNHQLLPLHPGLLWDKFAVQAAEVAEFVCHFKPSWSLLFFLGMGSVADKITLNLVRCSGVPLSHDTEGCIGCFEQPVKNTTSGCWNSGLSVMWRMVLIFPCVSFSSQEPADGGINFASIIYFTCLELCLTIRGLLW